MGKESPSSRRAWIEILLLHVLLWFWLVALLAEGVDRNLFEDCLLTQICESPSSRRAWIEIPIAMSALPPVLVALLAEGVDRNSSLVSSR